jgi:hypothetical protein
MSNWFKLIKRIEIRLNEEWIKFQDILPTASKDFSWKVRRRMRFDRNPIFVELQDKYKVKAYAQSQGVRVAELFYITDRPETIPFDTLPQNYFIKANHGCNWNILCNKGELYLLVDGSGLSNNKEKVKYKISRQECVKYCNLWLRKIYSKSEWAYQHIPPKIVVEECLISDSGTELKDNRFYVFDGVVKAISVDSPSNRLNHETVFLDQNWKEFKLSTYIEKVPDPFPEKPGNLQEMVQIAEKLGKGLDFVRVDLFNTNRGVTLGEMSFYPLSGGAITGDKIFNKWLGDQWKLPPGVE